MKPAHKKAPPTHLQVEVVRAFWIADREAQPGDVLTFPRGFAADLIAWGKAKPYQGPPLVQTGKSARNMPAKEAKA